MTFDPSHLEEKELLTNIKKGSKEAFEELYKRCYSIIYGYLFNFTFNHDLTSELVQETFVRIWEKRHLYKPELSSKSYILIIARNAYFQILRKSKREPQAKTEGVKEPSEVLEKKELNKLVLQSLKNLEPDLRETLTLIYLEGITYRETAEILGISQKGVEKRVHKAFEIIYGNLSKYVSE